ncbi:E3 ubiquitin-protein ligase parkin [Acropora cervicornis]|uniref:E3 ubiquitin-protein ligase parkin n=1 Tax=Acropora cervicornis TaxID=6130 RepID=A0AAD9UUB1_ACRCE|nr:E3 ubiquitin-protein ligase parkin [Acropora cervicornis]
MKTFTQAELCTIPLHVLFPVESCTDALIDEIHHFRVLEQQQYNRYQRFATEECLLREGGVLCPRAGCGMGLFLEPGMGPVVTCSSCNLVFCKECKEPCRREGCNHMTCPQCGFQWCWICVKLWNSECQSSHWFRQ